MFKITAPDLSKHLMDKKNIYLVFFLFGDILHCFDSIRVLECIKFSTLRCEYTAMMMHSVYQFTFDICNTYYYVKYIITWYMNITLIEFVFLLIT